MFQEVLEALTHQAVNPKLAELTEKLAHGYHPGVVEKYCQDNFYDWKNTSQAVELTVIRYAKHVEDLPIVLTVFSHPYLQPTGQCIKTDFFLGVLLGLFKGALWLDERYNWRLKGFEEKLLPVWVEILDGAGIYQLERDQPFVARFTGNEYKAYRGQFANIFKAYVRGEAIDRSTNEHIRSDRKAKRLIVVDKTINQLAILLSKQETDAPHAIMDYFLDQLTFAAFGSLSPRGRVISLNDYQGRILEHVMASNRQPAIEQSSVN